MRPAKAISRRKIRVPLFGFSPGFVTTMTTLTSFNNTITEWEGLSKQTTNIFTYTLKDDTWNDPGYSGDASNFAVMQSARASRPKLKYEIIYNPVLSTINDTKAVGTIWIASGSYTIGQYVMYYASSAVTVPNLLLCTATHTTALGRTTPDMTLWQDLGSLDLNSNAAFFGGNIEQAAIGVRDGATTAFFTKLVAAGLGDSDIRYGERLFFTPTLRYALGVNNLGGNNHSDDIDGGAALFAQAAARFKAIGRSLGWTGGISFTVGQMTASPTVNYYAAYDPDIFDSITYPLYDVQQPGVTRPASYKTFFNNFPAPLAAHTTSLDDAKTYQDANWNAMYATGVQENFRYWLDFARAHNKPIRITVGLTANREGTGNKDNPRFLQRVFNQAAEDYRDAIEAINIDNYKNLIPTVFSATLTWQVSGATHIAMFSVASGTAAPTGRFYLVPRVSGNQIMPNDLLPAMVQLTRQTVGITFGTWSATDDQGVTLDWASSWNGTAVSFVNGDLPLNDHKLTPGALSVATDFPQSAAVLPSLVANWKHKWTV